MSCARFVAPLLFTCLLSAGCVPSTGQVERALERELPRAIGPADRYTVSIEGLRARSGEAGRVTVVGERVRRAEAPVLDRLDLELRGVRYDRSAKRLDRVESATATARIRPADLATFIEASRNVSDVSITLQPPDRATVRLRPQIGGIELPNGAAVEASGRLTAEGGRVHVDVETLRAAGLSLGGGVARRLSDAINPLVDLSDADADLRVTGVRVVDGAVQVEATGDLTGLRLE